MSHDDHDSSDRESLSLLRTLRSETPAPHAAMTNVMQRLATTLPAAAWAANEATISPALDVPSRGSSAVGAAGHALQSGAVAVTHPWTWAVGLIVAGGITGGALHAAFTRENVRVVYVDRPGDERSASRLHGAKPIAESAPSPVASVESAARADDSSQADSPATSIDAPRENAAPGASPWARERALLDAARRALAAGEPEKSLTELGKHARAFPSGKLAEERDALVVNALVSVARYAEARQKADAFARRYPHSFLAPSVQAAIAAIPTVGQMP